jgi:hypothetical protein
MCLWRAEEKGITMRRVTTYQPGVDEAVLAELRAIRAEIHHLSERVAAAATRDDLHNYVTAETFRAHEATHYARVESWRSWAPFALSAAAFCWMLFWTLIGQHIVLR